MGHHSRGRGRVAEVEVEVKVTAESPRSHWIWGAMKMPGRVLRELQATWPQRGSHDAYLGTVVNAWLAAGGDARAGW